MLATIEIELEHWAAVLLTSMDVLIYNTLVAALDTGKATSYGKKTNRVIFVCTGCARSRAAILCSTVFLPSASGQGASSTPEHGF